MNVLLSLLLAFTLLSHIAIAQCGNITAGDAVCQTRNYFQVGTLITTSSPDACNQLRAALGALNTSLGGVVDARGMVSSTLTALACSDSQATAGVTTEGDNPFYIYPTALFAPPSQLLLGAQTIALSRQWVVPEKSSIIGLSGTSGYTTTPGNSSSNTVLVACKDGSTFAPNCPAAGSTNYTFVPQITHCSQVSGSPTQIHCLNVPVSGLGLSKGNFVLIEGSGTDLDDAWEVTGIPTTTPPLTDFIINYGGSTKDAMGMVVNIPLIWLGTNVEKSPFADQGVSLQGLAVDCNDLPGSIGIFSATLNENSFLKHVSVRHCTRNGIFYKRTQANGAPANFGPDEDLTVYMSNLSPQTPSAMLPISSTQFVNGSTTELQINLGAALSSSLVGYPIVITGYPSPGLPGLFTDIGDSTAFSFIDIRVPPGTGTCMSSCGKVAVVPAGYRVEIGNQPWRGINGATIRPDKPSGANHSMDGIQIDGVNGGNIQDIHCEILNNCVSITAIAPSFGVVLQNISSGLLTAGIFGAIYSNGFSAGSNILASALVNFSNSPTTLVSDSLLTASGTPKTVIGNSLPLYATGYLTSTGSTTGEVIQNCGSKALPAGGSPTTLACQSVNAFSKCSFSPIGTPIPSSVTFTPSANSIAITYSVSTGTATIQVSCSI